MTGRSAGGGRLTGRIAGLVALCALAGGAAQAGADSFTPVRLAVHAPRAARLHHVLRVRIVVNADPSVLDTRTSALKLQVKLAPECAGVFGQTRGTVLINRTLRPQPVTGRAYHAVARGRGRPRRSGRQTVCVWLVERGDNRLFASDQQTTVEVRRR